MTERYIITITGIGSAAVRPYTHTLRAYNSLTNRVYILLYLKKKKNECFLKPVSMTITLTTIDFDYVVTRFGPKNNTRKTRMHNTYPLKIS